MIDNGKLSTYLISGLMVVFAAVLAEPELIAPLLGVDLYPRFVALVPLLVVLYNAYYPRNQPVELERA